VSHLDSGKGDRKLIPVCDRPFAPHLQFAKCTKPHLCIAKQNSPTPVHRWFNLAQKGLGRVIPGDERPGDKINVWRQEVFFCHSVFHLWSAQKAAMVLDLTWSFSSFSAAGTKGCVDLSVHCCVVDVSRSRSWRRGALGPLHGKLETMHCSSFSVKLSRGNTYLDVPVSLLMAIPGNLVANSSKCRLHWSAPRVVKG